MALESEDIEVKYVWTGRERIIDGSAGVQVTHKPTGKVVKITRHDKRLLNLSDAVDELTEWVEAPVIVKFKYYLHDNYTRSEFAGYVTDATGVEITEELMEKIGNPFYEIELSCTLNTETGEVEIMSILA